MKHYLFPVAGLLTKIFFSIFLAYIKLSVYDENHSPEVEIKDYFLPEEPKERQNGPPSTSSKVFNTFFSFDIFSLRYVKEKHF